MPEEQITPESEEQEIVTEEKEIIPPEEDKDLEEKPKETEEKKIGTDHDEEPQIRKTRLDYIAERKEKRLERLKQERLSKIDRELEELGDNGDSESDDMEYIEDEDEKKVVKTMKKYFGESLDDISLKEVKTDVSSFVEKNPEFATYKDKIIKWAQHPAYAKVPIERLAYAVVGPEISKLLSSKKAELESEMDKSKLGGGSRRGTNKKSVSDMTDDEFRTHVAKIQGQA